MLGPDPPQYRTDSLPTKSESRVTEPCPKLSWRAEFNAETAVLWEWNLKSFRVFAILQHKAGLYPMTVRPLDSSQDSIESNRVASDAPTSTGSSNDSLIGRLLRGTYRIIEALDEGGMGKLYRAEHQRLRRPVAVKVMAQYLSANREALTRFRREAEIVSQLDHPHIVHILDFDTTEHGDPYIVMELLTGETLSRRLDQLRILPLLDTIAIVSQVASALTAAHRAGIVHRDLKPDNVFLLAMRDGSIFVKLLDFGISKGSPKSARVTGKYDVLGTPDYMAPEQALDTSRVNHHADQWSLACMAYEMFTGHVPFAGDTAVQILAKVVTEPPPPLTHYVPDVPSSIQGVVMRGLAKDPFQRFPTIGDFADHLSRAAQAIISSDSWATEPHAEPVRNAAARAPTLDANPRQRTTKPLGPAARANPAQSSTESAYSSVLPEQRSLSGGPPPPQTGLVVRPRRRRPDLLVRACETRGAARKVMQSQLRPDPVAYAARWITCNSVKPHYQRLRTAKHPLHCRKPGSRQVCSRQSRFCATSRKRWQPVTTR